MLKNNLLLAFILMASQINYYGLYFKFLIEHNRMYWYITVYRYQAYIHYKANKSPELAASTSRASPS